MLRHAWIATLFSTALSAASSLNLANQGRGVGAVISLSTAIASLLITALMLGRRNTFGHHGPIIDAALDQGQAS